MLHRILLINSQVYTKAELLLHDTQSIQLVGPNNIGKSSLINTLNFLYITDPRQMKFEGNRSLKDSLPHYFPSIHNSYLLFELVNTQKNYSYCLLVKRNAKNELAYYYIPHAYQADWLFEKNAQGHQQVANFSQVLKKLEQIPADGTGLSVTTPITHKIRHQLLYTNQFHTSPAVQLTPAIQIQAHAHANPFTKLYKYLIRSTRISSQDLVDALLIAYPPANPSLEVFADRQSDELTRLLRIDKTITNLKAIENDFYTLQNHYKTYTTHHKQQAHTYHTFLHHYPLCLEEIQKHKKKLQKSIDLVVQQLAQHQAKMAQNRLALGACQNEHKHLQKAAQEAQKNLTAIAPYQTPLARKQLQHTIQELAQKCQLLEKWHKIQESPKELKKRIQQHTQRIAQLQQQIKDFDNRLIHHISADPAVKKQLSTLLAPTLLHAHKKAIKKPIQSLSDEMRLFDGLISIKDLRHHDGPFITLDFLKKQLKTAEQELTLAQKLQQDQATYTRTAQALRDKQMLWHSIQNENKLREEVSQAAQLVAANQKQQHELQAQLAKLQAAITVAHTQQTTLIQQKETLEAQTNTYSSWAETLATQAIKPIPPAQQPATTNLKALYKQLQTQQKQLINIQATYQPLFDKIKKHLQRYDDNPAALIATLQQQFNNLPETISSRNQLQNAIINKLVKPTQHFLKSYEEFKKALHQFGKNLSQHRISGIHHLEFHLNEYAHTLTQLQNISTLTPDTMLDLTGQREQGLQTLQDFLNNQRTFSLKALFNLQIRITLQPHAKPIILDTNRQMQSFGTDKTLRLFIFLQLLAQLLPANHTNRIAIYIDEVGTLSLANLNKLLARCRQTNILPIFAATTYVEGLQRYYHLQRGTAGKVQIDSKHIIDFQAQTQPDAGKP